MASNRSPRRKKNDDAVTFKAIKIIKSQILLLGQLSQLLHSSDIVPSDCDHVAEMVKSTKRLIINFNRSLAQLSNSKVKYDLIVPLFYVEDKLDNVNVLLKELRPICREDQRRKDYLQSQILENLEEITNVYTELYRFE
jgi:hypothetical protein